MTVKTITIRRVAVIGGTGLIGKPVVRALLKSGFDVTVFSRPSTTPRDTSLFPNEVVVKEVDYASVPALTAALANQDALVSCVPSADPKTVLDQKAFIDASVAAGVKHFIPSEFGAGRVPKGRALKFVQPKFVIHDYLTEVAKSHPQFSYSLLQTGPFLDLFLHFDGLVNFPGKGQLPTVVYGSGDQLWSSTTTTTIADAVAGILSNVAAFENRLVYVQDIVSSQNQLLAIAKKQLPDAEWKTIHVPVEQLEKEVLENDDVSHGEAVKLLLFGDNYGALWKQPDNQALGVKGWTKEDLEAAVAEVLAA